MKKIFVQLKKKKEKVEIIDYINLLSCPSRYSNFKKYISYQKKITKVEFNKVKPNVLKWKKEKEKKEINVTLLWGGLGVDW